MPQSEHPFGQQSSGMNLMRSQSSAASSVPQSHQREPQTKSKVGKIFDALLVVSLVALFLGTPLFFVGITYQGIAFEKQMYFLVWLLVGLIAWVSKAVITGEMAIRRTPLDIPLVLFLVWYGVATIFSVDKWHSFWGFFGDPSRGFIFILASVLFYYLLLSHFTKKRFAWMFGATLLSGGLAMFWSLLALLGVNFLPDTIGSYAPVSFMGSFSNLTVYASMLLPLFITGLFSLWDAERVSVLKRWIATVFLGAAIVAALFVLLALYNYVSWPVVLIGLALFLIYILARVVRPTEQLTWLPMVLFVCVLAFLMIGANNLARIDIPTELSISMKTSWQISSETMKHHFITGVGPAEYGHAFSLYRPSAFNETQLYTLRFYQGKNLFLEALATTGALGAILLAVLWLSYLSIGLYLLTINRAQNKTQSLGLFSASVMFFLAAIIGNPVGGPLFLIGILIGVLSLGILFTESHTEQKYLELSLKASPKFALALAFIFMVVSAGVAFLFVFLGKVAYADIQAGRAIRLSGSSPSEEATQLLVNAIRRYPQESRYYTRLGQEYMALANQGATASDDTRDEDAIVNFIRLAVVTAEAGRNKMTSDALATETLALIYENAGLYASDALAKALETYSEAQTLEPKNPVYDVKIGQIKRAQADAEEDKAKKEALLKESKDAFEAALEKKDNLAVAHYQIALTEARSQNYDASLDELAEALKIEPQNLNYEYNRGIIYQLKGGTDDLKMAEDIFLGLLKRQERLIDVRLSLGLLYETMGKNQEALSQYRTVLGYIPESDESVTRTREQVQKLIDNVVSGKGNLQQTPPPDPATPTPENIDQAVISPTSPENETPSSAGSQTEQPNQSPVTTTPGQ